MGDKRTGPGQSVAVGRGLGRFVYTEHNPLFLQPDVRTCRTYLVNRVSDGRFLGAVHHRIDSRWWTAQPRDSAEELPGRQLRREWAADQLDANSLQHVWCACGVSVAKHDRPTRAAMRAWAAASDPNRDVGAVRDALTFQAAFHSRFRGGHYNLTSCVEHARKFANPVAQGHLALVLPGQVPRQWVLVAPDAFLGGYTVYQWNGDQAGEVYSWPNRDRTAEYIRDVYLSRGYREVYDWRR